MYALTGHRICFVSGCSKHDRTIFAPGAALSARRCQRAATAAPSKPVPSGELPFGRCFYPVNRPDPAGMGHKLRTGFESMPCEIY